MTHPVLRPSNLRFPILRWGALAVCALALSSCISLLPKSKPATLYRFAGDRPTWCTARGARTEDLNVMLRRDRGRLHHGPLAAGAGLASDAEWAGLFVLATTEVASADGGRWQVPGMALASWANPRRGLRRLRADAGGARGWWLEVDRA